MRQHYIIPSVLSLTAVFWIYIAVTEYGLWDEGPSGGFMPVLSAGILLIFSIITLCSKKHAKVSTPLKTVLPVIFILALMGITEILGLLPAAFIMLTSWLRYVAGYHWRFSLLTASCVTTAIWIIFVKWLSVPFPTGLF